MTVARPSRPCVVRNTRDTIWLGRDRRAVVGTYRGRGQINLEEDPGVSDTTGLIKERVKEALSPTGWESAFLPLTRFMVSSRKRPDAVESASRCMSAGGLRDLDEAGGC